MADFVNPGDEIKAEQINDVYDLAVSADLTAQTANNTVTQMSSTVETAKGAFVAGFIDTQDSVSLKFTTVNGDVVDVALGDLIQHILTIVNPGG